MICITGDTHGDFDRFYYNKRMERQGIRLGENDYVIVCGDFGLCWAEDKVFKKKCKDLEDNKFTILWVQGNHENYDMIAEYPIEEWHGGKVRHIVRDKVILLERGQIFEIEEKTIFSFGGALSQDIQGGVLDKRDSSFDAQRIRAIKSRLPFRVIHESWWPQELPNEEEMEEGIRNLEKYNYQVDYVITHCCATSVHRLLEKETDRVYKSDILTDYFQTIEEKLRYKRWFFGHFHEDRCVDSKHTLLYRAIMKIEDNPEVSLSDMPILGKPKYRWGDMVEWEWNPNENKSGNIEIVDAYGTSDQNLEPSYDIFVEKENCVYKHICESEIMRKI